MSTSSLPAALGTELPGQHAADRSAVSAEAVADGELTVLVDDVRSFRDGRPCLVARSSAAGVELLQRLAGTRIDHLWLDHDLVGDDTIWPVVRHLETAWETGQPYDIRLVHLHAASSLAAHRMGITLRATTAPGGRRTTSRCSTWRRRRTRSSAGRSTPPG